MKWHVRSLIWASCLELLAVSTVAGQDAKNEPSAESTIGGTGRPVVGRVVLPEGKVLAKGLRGTAIGSELTNVLGR